LQCCWNSSKYCEGGVRKYHTLTEPLQKRYRSNPQPIAKIFLTWDCVGDHDTWQTWCKSHHGGLLWYLCGTDPLTDFRVWWLKQRTMCLLGFRWYWHATAKWRFRACSSEKKETVWDWVRDGKTVQWWSKKGIVGNSPPFFGLIFTHAESSRGVGFLPPLARLFFRTISQKPMQLETPNLTHKCSTMSLLCWDQKVEGHESQKHCWCGSLHFLWVLASSSWHWAVIYLSYYNYFVLNHCISRLLTRHKGRERRGKKRMQLQGRWRGVDNRGKRVRAPILITRRRGYCGQTRLCVCLSAL